MSKYTTQLRFIIEMNSEEGFPISQRIEQATSKIFNFNYPIWSEDYRKILEKKILMHYFNKEIGLETVGLWKLYLEERLNLIMPYYNEMYLTTSNKYDWLIDVDVTETYEGNKNISGNVKDNSNGEITDKGKDTSISSLNETTTGDNSKTLKSLKSDLPQANFQGLDYGTELQEDTATDNKKDTHTATSNSTIDKNNTTNSTTNSTTESKSQTNDLFTRINKGLNGSRSKTQLNLEYRQSLINIDKMIIDELSDLFMLIY